VVLSVLKAVPDALRGLVRVSAVGMPDGQVLVTRTARRTPEQIRGGAFASTTGGFIREDPEAAFGEPLVYRVTDTVNDRHIQSNRILNPKAKNNTANWTAGANRTLAQETNLTLAPSRDALTSLRVGPNTAGVNPGGLPERALLRTTPSGFGPGRWFFSGQMMYDSPDIWLWDDVKQRTWSQVRDKGAWQQVKSASSELAGQPFATLWAAVMTPTGTVVVPPFQVLGVQVSDGGGWATFQATVEVPAGAPAGVQLVFLQGPLTREYAVTWWLSTVMVTPESEMDAGALPYFDGDTLVPANPAANLVPGYAWQTLTKDASIAWNGTENASVSIFTGPSVIYAEAETHVNQPDAPQLPGMRLPVFLSDPVAPQLSQWFELLEIGDLNFAARAALYDILGRGPQIAVSQLRAWANGELRLMTYTVEQARVAERMFESGRILFLRNPDPRFPESVWYLHIGDVTQGRVGAQVAWSPQRIWRVPFARVERPEGLIAASSSVTWSDVKKLTWGEVRQQREDWLDAALTRVTT